MARKTVKYIQFLRWIRGILILAGLLFSAVILTAFTALPFRAFHWLGTSVSSVQDEPRTIIMLGGSGMPSESNLMRCWYTARLALQYPESRVVVAMPGDTTDMDSTPNKLRNELIIRGITRERIDFESRGTNTRFQALEILRMIESGTPILIVTSPEHMRRAVLSFRKAGFSEVSSVPAFENTTEVSLSFIDRELGGRQTFIPGVGNNIRMRYQVWTQLKYQVLVARELAALSYYRARGWI